MTTDATLADVEIYLRGVRSVLHICYQNRRWIAWMTGEHGETRALGTGPTLIGAVDAMAAAYAEKHDITRTEKRA